MTERNKAQRSSRGRKQRRRPPRAGAFALYASHADALAAAQTKKEALPCIFDNQYWFIWPDGYLEAVSLSRPGSA